MSKILYLECNMGAAGDMISAALYELLTEEQKVEFLHLMNEHCMTGVSVIPDPAVKCGVQGTHMTVLVNGKEEAVEDVLHHDHHGNGRHCHAHDRNVDTENNGCHENEHGSHHHASLDEIHDMIRSCGIPEDVKTDVMKVYDLLAEAESHAHGVSVSEIHFHEVGMLDAITDVIATCLLLSVIAPDEVVVSPVNTGFGQVRCAHGILPVPAPATAYLLQGAPVFAGSIEGELCTPTGAALLQHIKTRFNNMPAMKIEKIGYGMGQKDFPQANCVRAFLGKTAESMSDKIVELSCNIDDMTGEELGFAAETLRGNGALEVFFTAVQMKKNRPGQVLTCLCRSEDEERMAALILKHTSTWGVRRLLCDRYVLERHTEERETPYGAIRVRCGSGYGVEKCKVEYEDVAAAARAGGVTLREIEKL